MKLTPEECKALQDQNLMRQQALQQQALRMQNMYVNTTSGSSASSLGNYNINTAAGVTTNTTWPQYQPFPASQAPLIERLEKLEPGWYYIRWRKPDDQPAEAWAVPIIALAVISGRVEYQLAGATVQAQSEMRPETFLGIVTPKETYDADVWHKKARAAYYEFHAAEVATALLRGMAQGAKTL